MTEPLISVILPVYNAGIYLAEALASIRAQGMASLEIIVVDDGSTDGSASIARQHSDVAVVTQENRGPAAARNRGIALAKGTLLAFLDADDLWMPQKLERQLALLHADCESAMVYGQTQCLRSTADGEWETFGRPRPLPSFGALLARKAVFSEVGPVDERLRCAEDVDWFARARDAGIPTGTLAEVVLQYRLHGTNLTRSRHPQHSGHLTVVRKLLERRRRTRP